MLLFPSPESNMVQRPAVTETRTDPTVHTQSPERQTPAVNRQELLAARFAGSPELEDLVQSTVRSEETSVHTPANGATVRSGARFSWTTSAHPPFELTVLDNQRHTVRSYRMATTQFVLRDSLEAGLYYWKLAAEGGLLHVGKFIVR
jgi:hypothetical protein